MNMQYILFYKWNFILLVLYVFFILTNSHGENKIVFTTIDYYESFSTPKECFIFQHNNPTGPWFLLAEIEYYIFSLTFGKSVKHVNRKYELKRKNKPCRNAIAIKTINDHSRINLSVKLLFYYDEKAFAEFIYEINNDFKRETLNIIDTKNNFWLKIRFSDYANEENLEYNFASNDVSSYINSFPKHNGSICVITQNNRQMILKPEYLVEIRGLITRLRGEQIQDGETIYYEDYPAFECYPELSYAIDHVSILNEGFGVNIKVSLIHWKIDSSSETYIFTAKFFNLHVANIYNAHTLPSTDKKLFCVKTDEAIVDCPGDKTILLISDTLYVYNNITKKMVDEEKGIRRFKIFSHSSDSLCT